MPIRTLPNNLEAEESVLGACFLTKYAMQKAIESVSPEDFYDEKNQKIFKSIIELSDESTPLDLTTLTAKLQKKKELNEVGEHRERKGRGRLCPAAGGGGREGFCAA